MSKTNKDNTNDTAITFSSISNQQAVSITGTKGVDQTIQYEWINTNTGETKLFNKGVDKTVRVVDGAEVSSINTEFTRTWSRQYDPERVKVVFRGKLTDELFATMTKFHRPLEGTELVLLEDTYVLQSQQLNPDKTIESVCTFKQTRLYQVIEQEIDNKLQKYRVSSSVERFINDDGKADTRTVYFSYINLRTMFQPTNEMPLDSCISMFQD